FLPLLGRRRAASAHAFRQNNGPQFFARLFQLVVDQNVVIFIVLGDFTAGGDQASLDHVFAIFAAIAQTPFQCLSIGRQNEDADRVGQGLLDLCGALDVDVQKKVVPVLTRLPQVLASGAITISMHSGMFQELTAFNHFFEFFERDKVILLAVLLAAPEITSSVGN